MYCLIIHILLLLSIIAHNNCARAKDMDENPEFSALLNLELRDLHNVNFTSLASKIEEPVADAGGSVSIFSANDIKRFAYYTLGDLADITPGYSSHIRFGERVFETRGQKAGSFNNDRHLLLVDGIPIHHARNYKVFADNELPLFFADKVEFLRGPASALYGNSAMFGIINISPQEFGGEGLKIEGRVSSGSPEYQTQVLLNTFYNSSLGKSTLSLGYFRKDASKNFVGLVDDPAWLNYDNQDSRFVFFKHRFDDGFAEGLSIGLLYNRKEGGLGEYWLGGGSYSSNELTWESIIPYIKYQTEFSDSVNFSAYFKHNSSWEVGNVVLPSSAGKFRQKYESQVQDYEAQAEISYTFLDNSNFILGFNVDSRQELGFPESSSFTQTSSGFVRNKNLFPSDSSWIHILSVYPQIRHEFDFLKGTIVTVGARYTVGLFENQKNTNFSPRIAVTQRIRNDLNLKFQYSSAFRMPGIKEIGFNTEKSADITKLKPEEFETAEISLVYHLQHMFMELNFFYNRTSDVIDFVEEEQFVNLTGKTTSIGGEFSVKYDFVNGFDLNFNYSYTQSNDPKGNNLDDIPTQKANLILNYTDTLMSKPYNISLINRWIKDFSVSTEQDKPKGYLITDINMGVDLSNYAEIGFQVRNLWDNRYKIPNNGRSEIPMPERTMLGYIRFSY